MRSLCSITKPALCSTSSTAQPVSSRTAWICSPRRSISVSSSPDAGSSSSSSLRRVDDRPGRTRPSGRCRSGASRRARVRTAMRPQRSSTSSTARAPLASRGGAGSGRRRDRRANPPPPPRHSSAASTLSSTVSHRRSAPAGTCAACPGGPGRWPSSTVTSAPSSDDAAARSGVRMPEMTSNRVVLPAPLGPMIPSTSPAAASKSTSPSAAMPPKRTVMPSRCRMVEPAGTPSPRGSTCTSAVTAVPLDRVEPSAGGS